ncbi:S24 family peptidase [Emticicia sp. 17c]|uniref:S24 family peptidase n=1 Tax=Emticicia sp. 17c TaxID=3127704 RepID=UPI00301D8C7D
MNNLEKIIKMRLAELNMQAKDLVTLGAIKNQSALNTMYSRNSARPETLAKIADALKLPASVFYEDSLYNDVKVYTRELKHIELPYISVKARATFVNSLNEDIPVVFDTYSVLITDENEDMSDQIVFAIDGDSMEPFYTKGMLVRAKKVPPSDWIYISSGVYIVHYAKVFLVVKRVKTNELQSTGFLRLHSDNEITGGSIEVAGKDIHNIWKIVWIVGSPPR